MVCLVLFLCAVMASGSGYAVVERMMISLLLRRKKRRRKMAKVGVCWWVGVVERKHIRHRASGTCRRVLFRPPAILLDTSGSLRYLSDPLEH